MVLNLDGKLVGMRVMKAVAADCMFFCFPISAVKVGGGVGESSG